MKQRALWAVGGVYALAWFLPVVKDGSTLGEGVLPGWEALRVSLSPLWEEHFGGNFFEAALSVGSGLSNLAFVAAFVHLTRREAPRARLWSWILCAAVAVDSFWIIDDGGPPDLRAGYFLWWGSFALLGIVSWRRGDARGVFATVRA